MNSGSTIAVGVAIMVASVLFTARTFWRGDKQITNAPGYHSHKAAAVMLVGSELLAMFALVVSDIGPDIGLDTTHKELISIGVGCALVWIVYQGARRWWPAGSD